MNINLAKVLLISASLTFASWAQSASVTVTGLGTDFIIEKVSGFSDGTSVVANGQTVTVGQAREDAFVAAAQVWADILVSPVDITVDAEFSSSLYCISNSATLGSAGPLSTYFGAGAESLGLQNNVWYPTALINAHNGSDYFPGSGDISATFNADLGDANCLASSGWYYGTDGNVPAGYIDFYEVVLHELGHGLGILSLVNSDGTNNSGVVDIFTTFLSDKSTAKNWSAMNNSERNASVINTSNVVWNGAEVTALTGDLSAGVNAGNVQMYAPNPYEGGSSISHFDTALTPNELMEPQYTGGASYDHSKALLKDIGWDIYVPANAVPVITAQSALSLDEDTNITLALSDLTVTDADNSFPADFSLTVLSGSNYSVSGATVTPTADFSGTLTVPVTVNDGEDDSAQYSLSITVNNLNDKPTITGQSTLNTNEDIGLTLTTAHLTIDDPDDASFSLTVSGGANYSVSGSTVTPSANYYGALTVPVIVNDGEIDSDSFNVSITVVAQNDAPIITGLPTVSTDEDVSVDLVVGDFTITDVDSGSHSLTILSGSNYSVMGSTVVPDLNYSGVLTVGVTVSDGSASSSTESLSVTVNAVNDAPVISGSPATVVTQSANYSASFSTTDVDSNSFTYSVSSPHAWLSINGSGVLSGVPSAGDIGEQLVTVTVSDGDLDDDYAFNLTVADSTMANLSTLLSSADYLVALNTNVVAEVTVENSGPAAFADGYVLVDVATGTQIVSVDSGCTLPTSEQMRCDFSDVASDITFAMTLARTTEKMDTLSAEVFGSQTDPISDNNTSDTSVLFRDSQTMPSVSASVLSSTSTQAASVADLDGDDQVELVLANGTGVNEGSYQVNGTFDVVTADVVFSSNADARSIQLVDLNNDDFIDVVFASDGANSVYINQANSGFSAVISLGSADSLDVIAVDLNDDDFLDLVFANEGANQIYLNDQADGFVAMEVFGSSRSTGIATIDSNADGYPDLVIANADDDDLIYLNNGADQSSGILDASPVLLGTELTHSNDVVVADLNDDGVVNEILVARNTIDSASSLEIYQVVANVVSSLFEIDGGDVVSISAADADADTDVDFVALNQEGVAQLFIQNGSGFERSHTFEAANSLAVSFMDMNDDNKADWVITADENAATRLFVSSGDVVETVVTSFEPQVEPEVEPVVTVIVVEETSTGVVVVKSGSLGGVLILLALLLIATRRPILRGQAIPLKR